MSAATTAPHSDGVLAVELAGAVIYVNRAAELLIGQTRQDLLGRKPQHLLGSIDRTVPQELHSEPIRR